VERAWTGTPNVGEAPPRAATSHGPFHNALGEKLFAYRFERRALHEFEGKKRGRNAMCGGAGSATSRAAECAHTSVRTIHRRTRVYDPIFIEREKNRKKKVFDEKNPRLPESATTTGDHTTTHPDSPLADNLKACTHPNIRCATPIRQQTNTIQHNASRCAGRRPVGGAGACALRTPRPLPPRPGGVRKSSIQFNSIQFD
jgi:hypothetical protein